MKLPSVLLGLLFCFLLSSVTAQSAASSQDYEQRFETAWRLVAERYWDVKQLPVDWPSVKRMYEPRALNAKTDTEFYTVLEDMYDELGDNHSVFVPPERVEEIRESYGDLPCVGVFAFNSAQRAYSAGSIDYDLLDEHIGYIRIPDLASSNVAGNTRTAVKQLTAMNADSFILDLRDNPGGRLVEMMQVAGIFTNGFLWRTITRWTFPLPYPAVGVTETELPVVILINQNVNSAAEGLAGALQQTGRATIIGETSAGNVEAVLPFCLRDGSQAWIATGVLAPIGGPTWDGQGVIPDIETSSDDALDEGIRFLNTP